MASALFFIIYQTVGYRRRVVQRSGKAIWNVNLNAMKRYMQVFYLSITSMKCAFDVKQNRIQLFILLGYQH